MVEKPMLELVKTFLPTELREEKQRKVKLWMCVGCSLL